ncbi:conserved Plasmodium protein, unknown function [Plasmodium knowlesi strain H]|uniref:RCK N-terminal domain-containing protein n=3 Tax=Plasmodium knowlesi TaxID=5850 RepID=A0A1A7VTT1_PLAKH|nr:conserved Plasmodium protein, unknown function [Plasmodium knowlesi strain H]OTN66708.1 Uncharacterized protein PKNOH_S08486200 [Plasmodium knowlesi]CAA9986865.1 conserved Plasmodium protein, unknown function [Plasmodium knowlesi strain H]SBO23713.1 conserved Plasmodium protein, unknown function [Plasmodium knowlesi strain H]SBO25362.1 conserved Plasmodium protein, unknown function [Plasmodium knowlesi strain H]VVS76339.1 conserved Plasmodium protein, unknown function [Plasmodium knowlesi s
MCIYDVSIRYSSLLFLILIYVLSYFLAILPEITNSIRYTLFYKTRKRKIYSYSLKKEDSLRRKSNDKELKIDHLVDTSFLYMNQDHFEKVNFGHGYSRGLNRSSGEGIDALYSKEGECSEEGSSSGRSISVEQSDNVDHAANPPMQWQGKRRREKKERKYSKNEINDYVLKKTGRNKKYIIDSCEEFEKICLNDQRKTLKMKDRIIKYIELNDSEEEGDNFRRGSVNVGSANVGSVNFGSANVGSVNFGSANFGSANFDSVNGRPYQFVNQVGGSRLSEEGHSAQDYLKKRNEKEGKHLGSFIYDTKYLNIQNEECTEESIRFQKNKKKYMCFMVNNMLHGRKEMNRWKTSYLQGLRSNTNKYTLHSFYDRNKHVQKDTDFSRWHNLFLKFIINIKVVFVKFCKNTSFIISDLLITLMLHVAWLNVYNYLRRNDVSTDTGMFNWNTEYIPPFFTKVEAYIQYFILYDICVKFFLFFCAKHILSFWFLLNLMNSPFFYLIVSYVTNCPLRKHGWLYLTCPFRFLNFLRIDNLIGQSNNHNKINFPVITLSVQILVVIYTYACIHLLIEQPCRGDYQIYDYIFSGMQTVSTAAMGRGTCFPFTLQSKITHTFYIFMIFTYIHYQIRYLKNHMVEEKKIYGKIPNIGARYFVIIGHMKPIALYVIINELQSTYNNLDEIIFLTSLPVKFYLNIIRLLNRRGYCQISLCLYDLNKPFPLKIKKIISFSSGIFICNNVMNTHHNINNDMETLKRYNEINSLGPFNKCISVFLNNISNNSILLKRSNRNIICLNELKMKLFAKTLDDCPGMFLLTILFFINTPQKLKSKHTYILSKYFDNLEEEINPETPPFGSSTDGGASDREEDHVGSASTHPSAYKKGDGKRGGKSCKSHTQCASHTTNKPYTRSRFPSRWLHLFSGKRSQRSSTEGDHPNGKQSRESNFYKIDLRTGDTTDQNPPYKKRISRPSVSILKRVKSITQGGTKKKMPFRGFLSYEFDESMCYNSYNNYLHYIKGIKYNIYKIKLPKSFLNLHFITIVQYMFMNYNAFLIGIINEYNEVILNPVHFIYTCLDVQFILLTDKYNILQKIQNQKKVQLDWLNSVDCVKIKKSDTSNGAGHKSGSAPTAGHHYYSEMNKLKGQPGVYFNPVLSILRVDNYLQALEFFRIRREGQAGQAVNHSADEPGGKANHPHDDFIILIYWPQSINTFLKVLHQRKRHNILILSDQIPSYIHNNKLAKYSICYIQKSPLSLYNLILAGILRCKKCVIFKNYLKLNSHHNIISYNEKAKNINYFEYMCEHNDSDLLIIFNNIQNIFRRRDINDALVDYYIRQESNPSKSYDNYLLQKKSTKKRDIQNGYDTQKNSHTVDAQEMRKMDQACNNIINDKSRKTRKNIYLLIELNNTLSIQYLNNDVYTNIDILKKKKNKIINMNKAHNLLFIENYKKQIQFFKYGNLLVENIFKKIEHIFVDNYYFYLYFLQFTSASVFIDELIYHLIGYTFPIKNNSLSIGTIEAFINGTYADSSKRIKSDLLLRRINPKYHSRNFFFLFQKYLKKGSIVIGIYRCNEENNMSIVIPCPQRNFIMHKSDKVYVIESQYRAKEETR